MAAQGGWSDNGWFKDCIFMSSWARNLATFADPEWPEVESARLPMETFHGITGISEYRGTPKP